jgi:hypothetical protein
MVADRQLLEERHLAKDAVKNAALMESLGQPTPRKEREPRKAKPPKAKPRKAKEAEVFTCRRCPGKYTDATDSGGKCKRNHGFCSVVSAGRLRKRPH